jgi:uncharacterized membrane protein
MTATTLTDSAPSKGSTLVLAVLAVLGAAAFVHGVTRGEPTHAWATYLVNLLVLVEPVHRGARARGDDAAHRGALVSSVKRVALSTGAFLPISFALFLVLLFSGWGALYPWVNNPAWRRRSISG